MEATYGASLSRNLSDLDRELERYRDARSTMVASTALVDCLMDDCPYVVRNILDAVYALSGRNDFYRYMCWIASPKRRELSDRMRKFGPRIREID